jgi:hypothetical protein
MRHIVTVGEPKLEAGLAELAAKEVRGERKDERVSMTLVVHQRSDPCTQHITDSLAVECHRLILTCFCPSQTHGHCRVCPTHARIVGQHHIAKAEAGQLTHTEVAVESKEAGDGGTMETTLRHVAGKGDGDLPRERRIGEGFLHTLPSLDALTRGIEESLCIGSMEADGMERVRGIGEGGGCVIGMLYVKREESVEGGGRQREELGRGEACVGEEAAEGFVVRFCAGWCECEVLQGQA